jgi:osmotically-inducible protein OsmY
MRIAKPAAWAFTALLGMFLAACSSAPRQQPAREAIADGVVTARVKAALVEDPLTSRHRIDVATFKGTVQLSGFVESEDARRRAVELARSVAGVGRVKDALEIRQPAIDPHG